MVKGGKDGHRSNFKKRGRSKDEDSDGSDEDYVVSDEGNEESEDDEEEYCSSLDECASEEGFGGFLEDEEEKVVRKAVRSKSKARKRKVVERKPPKERSVSDEEDDEDYEVEEEEDDEDEYEVEYEVEEEEDDDDDHEEEEYDDDDNEFTLDEEDCFDEEEGLTLTKKKNSVKVGKQGLRKKSPSKQRKKRKKSEFSKKPSSKGERKKHRLKRKRRVEEEDDEDCDFVDNNPIVRKKSRTNGGRRNKAYVVPSDSDFVSSGASDYEYTISEEERKPVKEASQLCGSLKTSLRSSSSSKIIEEVGELGQHKKPLGRKGKENVEEKKAEVIKPVCGICLSEEDKRRFRGTLNCCSHYFCFTCIMAWSKVESRCPLCKQRFETISKPTRSTEGVDLREVVIQAPNPKRDQIYQRKNSEAIWTHLLCRSGVGSYLKILTRCKCRRKFRLTVVPSPSPRMPLTPGIVGLSSPRFPSVDVTAGSPVSGAGAPTLTGRRWLHRHFVPHSIYMCSKSPTHK